MDGKSKAIPEPVCCDRHIWYKKKAGKICVHSNDGVYFTVFLFHIGKDGTSMYKKTVDHLALYNSKQFKNCSKIILCLETEEYVGHEAPVMPNNPTDNDKMV